MNKRKSTITSKKKKFESANISDSSTAFFIDSLLLILILSVISYIAFPNFTFPGWLKLVVYIVSFFIYETFLLLFNKNTIGKSLRQMAVRSSSDNSNPISFLNIIIRTSTKFLLGIFSIILMLFSSKSTSGISNLLHNKLSGSTVVKIENEKYSKIAKNKWLKLGIALSIYLLWIVWLTNFWLMLGIPILFDIYVSKKINWAFWNKRNEKKKNVAVEWIDAIVFAVVAASIIRIFFIEAYTIPTPSMEKSLMVGDYLFVSKVSYGPKVPNSPVAFPFVHHTLPFTKHTKSFSEIVISPKSKS